MTCVIIVPASNYVHLWTNVKAGTRGSQEFSHFPCVFLPRWSKWLTAQFFVHLYLAQPRVMRSIKDFRFLSSSSGVISQSSRCKVCERFNVFFLLRGFVPRSVERKHKGMWCCWLYSVSCASLSKTSLTKIGLGSLWFLCGLLRFISIFFSWMSCAIACWQRLPILNQERIMKIVPTIPACCLRNWPVSTQCYC